MTVDVLSAVKLSAVKLTVDELMDITSSGFMLLVNELSSVKLSVGKLAEVDLLVDDLSVVDLSAVDLSAVDFLNQFDHDLLLSAMLLANLIF
jgi:hypothetical protein